MSHPLYKHHALHEVHIIPTGEESLHSTRPRYRMVCATCNVVIHPGTNGPLVRLGAHLDGNDIPYEAPEERYIALSVAEIQLLTNLLDKVGRKEAEPLLERLLALR